MSSEASITPELEPELVPELDPAASPPPLPLPSSDDAESPPLLPPLLDPPSPEKPVSPPELPQPAATLPAHAKRKAQEKSVRTTGSDHAKRPGARFATVAAVKARCRRRGYTTALTALRRTSPSPRPAAVPGPRPSRPARGSSRARRRAVLALGRTRR